MDQNKFAIIYEDTIHHEGDERSRTHPGHGYPAYTETVEKVKTFKNEADFMAWINSEEVKVFGKKKYKAIKYTELTIKTKITVSVSVD